MQFKRSVEGNQINLFWLVTGFPLDVAADTRLLLARDRLVIEDGVDRGADVGRGDRIVGAGSGGFNRQKAQQIMEDEFGKLNCHIAVTLVIYAGRKAAKP